MVKKDINQPIADPVAEILKLTQQDQKKTLEENYWPIEYLPSRYKLYPEGSKLYARTLNVREAKQLATIKPSNMDYILNEIVRKTTYGIPVEDLLIEDKLFIIFWLRDSTYKDSGFTIDSYCPNDDCKAKMSVEFEVNNLDIIDLKDDVSEDYELTLKKSKDKLKIKFLRVKDENRVENFKESNKNSLQEYDEDFLSTANRITEINGEATKSLRSTYNYVEALDPVDFSYLLSYIAHINFGVNPVLKNKCPSCGGDAPIGVTFRPDFFIPTYKFE